MSNQNPVFALSAGHGLYTAGKRCHYTLDANETREWWLNDRICDLVEEMLKAYVCTVVRVNDTTGKVCTDNRVRAKNSDAAGADLYIAVHHNAAGRVFDGGGTVIYYYPTGNSKQLAQSMYNHIVNRTGLVGDRRDKIIGNRGFIELNTPKATSLLIENGYMDSTVDVPIILSTSHAKKTAEGIVAFLVENYSLQKTGYKPITSTPTTTTSNKTSNPANLSTYTVQSGQSLSKIGSLLGIDWKYIAQINGIKAPYIIRKGQVLKLSSASTNTSTTTSNEFKVKVKVPELNIRKGPGTNYKIVNSIKNKGVYTIIEVNGSWGRLKSKAGWINISKAYVDRV